MLSNADLSLAAGKELTCHMAASGIIFYRKKAASGMILQNHRRLPVCILSVKIAALNRVTGRIFKVN